MVLTWHLYAKSGWLEVTRCDRERWRCSRLSGTGEEGDKVGGQGSWVSER
jgi:hypothetical protein